MPLKALSAPTNDPIQKGPLLALLIMSAGPVLVRSILLWPLLVIGVALAWNIAAKRNPKGWRWPDWLGFGRRDAVILVATAAIIVIASSALLLWKSYYHPNLQAFASRLPGHDLLLLILTGVIFSTLNAFSEEVVFRGLLLEVLRPAIGIGAALVIHAILFGVGHYGGIPRGYWGVAMATVYGFALGILRWKANGMGTCIIAHICADATIYWMVADG